MGRLCPAVHQQHEGCGDFHQSFGCVLIACHKEAVTSWGRTVSWTWSPWSSSTTSKAATAGQATFQPLMTMSMKKILQATILTRPVLGVMILVGMEMMICLAMKMVLELKKGDKLSTTMNKANTKMININMKKHLEKMSFLKVLDLPAILITAMLHLMLVELLMMDMVLLKRKLLPEMFLVTMLHPLRTKIKAVQLMLVMEPPLELELKVNIQLQEVLMKSTVLLVSMRGARVVFHSL